MGVSDVRSITVLGSTGSIGVSTLDVIARHPQRFRVFALSCATRWRELLAQCRAFSPEYAVVLDSRAATELRAAIAEAGLGVEVLEGEQGLVEIATHPAADTVMAAIVGAAGLMPSIGAARAGKRVLLANKESLVMAGAFFMEAVRAGGAELLPIDSEHFHVAAERHRRHHVLRSVAPLVTPDRLAAPDREAQHLDATAACNPEMAVFVDCDENPERHHGNQDG